MKESTDGIIPHILDEIPEEAVMYLINALSFDAQWQTIYTEYQVCDRTFTTEDSMIRDAELMYSTESLYLENENATGFIKYYSGGKYAFAALLPNEGVTAADYVNTLTGEHLQNLLSSPEETMVFTAIPKFETETSVELSGTLKAMCMTDAFDMACADFSAMGSSQNGPLFINRVLHKTYITVDERGTKAGAVTAVETKAVPTSHKISKPFAWTAPLSTCFSTVRPTFPSLSAL